MMNESLPFSFVTIPWKKLTNKIFFLREIRPEVVSGAIFSNDGVYFWSLKVESEFLSDPTLCHRSSFNAWCDVSVILSLKASYVSLIHKSRIVLKIFTSPFLSYTPPQRGEIPNFINRQTKSAWKIYNKLINPPQSALYTPRDQYS